MSGEQNRIMGSDWLPLTRSGREFFNGAPRIEPREFGPACPECGRRGMVRLLSRIYGCQRCKCVALLTVGASGLVMVPLGAKQAELDELRRRMAV